MQTTNQTTTCTEATINQVLENKNLTGDDLELAKKVMHDTIAASSEKPEDETVKLSAEELDKVKVVIDEGDPTTPETEKPIMNIIGEYTEQTEVVGSFFSRHRKALLIGTGTVAGIAGLYLIGAHTAAGQKTVEFIASKAKMAMGAVGSLLGSGEKVPETADAEAASEGIEAPTVQEDGSLNPPDVANPAGDAQDIATEAAQTLGEGSEEALAAQDVANSYK